jgi:hypothetical protein
MANGDITRINPPGTMTPAQMAENPVVMERLINKVKNNQRLTAQESRILKAGMEARSAKMRAKTADIRNPKQAPPRGAVVEGGGATRPVDPPRQGQVRVSGGELGRMELKAPESLYMEGRQPPSGPRAVVQGGNSPSTPGRPVPRPPGQITIESPRPPGQIQVDGRNIRSPRMRAIRDAARLSHYGKLNGRAVPNIGQWARKGIDQSAIRNMAKAGGKRIGATTLLGPLAMGLNTYMLTDMLGKAGVIPDWLGGGALRRGAQRKRDAAETTARMEFFHDYYRENFPDMSDSEINLLVDNTEREHRDMKNELNTGADYTQFVPDPAQVSKALSEYNELTTLGISQDIQPTTNFFSFMDEPTEAMGAMGAMGARGLLSAQSFSGQDRWAEDSAVEAAFYMSPEGSTVKPGSYMPAPDGGSSVTMISPDGMESTIMFPADGSSPQMDAAFEASDDAMLEDNFVEPSFDPFVPTEGEQDVLPGQSRVENPVSY